MPTRDQYIAAFEGTGGNVIKSAKQLGVSHQTVYNDLAADETLAKELERIREGKQTLKAFTIYVSAGIMERFDAVAKERKTSRSKLFSKLVEDFLE